MKAFCMINEKMLLRNIHALFVSHSHVPPVNTEEPLIHRLPVELLQQVFLLTAADVLDCPSIFSFGETTISVNVASPPLVLTRVCRLWRVIAHSTPGVWSHIQVVFSGRIRPLKPFLPHLLKCWLSRSGSQPLTLRIAHKREDHSEFKIHSEADSQLLDVLFSERRRWETVIMSPIYYRSQDFDTPQLRTLGCCWGDFRRFDAPNISRLYIKACYCCKNFQIGTRISMCKKKLHLRHLHLHAACLRDIHHFSDFSPSGDHRGG
ncbi:hypothetical protein EDB19DRAFT_1853801 [Suillus lakei]|nr:hypothetical protein EDB19DRAFT_1853801 [Suillus lakei]